jgi:hypothetical protein
MKTIGIILSYNNPTMTDRLVENINTVFKKNLRFIVLDNGSDVDKISSYTTHKIEKNCRMTRGFNHGIEIIEKEFPDYDNIWFFTNDCYFLASESCPLESSENFIQKYPQLGILHPSESKSVDVCYDVYHDPSIGGVKIVTEYDIVCPIFTRKAIEAIGGRFNDRLYQGWGIDHESSFLIRKNMMEVGINHEIVIDHDTSSTYDAGLDNLHSNRKSYYNSAMQEMYNVFNDMYGYNWHQKFTTLYASNKGKVLS